MQDTFNNTQRKVFSSHTLLEKILTPYKRNCHYLQKAYVELDPLDSVTQKYDGNRNLLRARGEFSIPESCYIVTTGHFNAVEFNICYNQLGYYLLAECVENKLLGDFLDWDSEEYFQRQLSNVLIIKFSSVFHKIMCSDRFNGYIEVNKLWLNKEKTLFIQTDCGFNDDQGGASTGSVLFAIIENK